MSKDVMSSILTNPTAPSSRHRAFIIVAFSINS